MSPKIKTGLLFLSILFFVLLTLRLFSGPEDLWVCTSSGWQKHGRPDSAKPSSACPIEKSELNFDLYFVNSKFDPEMMDCSKLFAVQRKASTDNSDKYLTAVNSLIAGLSEAEKSSGYSSFVDAETKLRSLSLQGGVITIDFSKELENNSGGSCRAQALRSQIERSLKQFPEIKEVKILVEGREDVLQP